MIIVDKFELKPCPFCGSTEHLQIKSVDEVHEDDCEIDQWTECSHTVICNVQIGGCGCSCGYVTGGDSVIDKWNTRAWA